MALTPRIELRQSQTLVMTPQLQQAIRLLQMSNLELVDYLAAEVERNPLLELAPPVPRPRGSAVFGDGDAASRVAAEVTLWEHLHTQIGAMRLSSAAAEAAMAVADELEEDGYLRVPLEEVAARHRLGSREAASALEVVQSCDPPGVGARNLEECLALQLRDLDRLDPAMQALLANLRLTASGNRAELQRICGVSAEDFADMLAELRALDPKPGLRHSPAPVQVAVPDIYVSRRPGGGLNVELNTETLPRVLIDNRYMAELRSGDAEARAFIAECRSSGSWLVRAIEQRARTMLKVATDVVTHQERFFADGAAELRPLTQKTVADRVGLHESTVSRVASGKFILCEQGTFEMRYFFSSAVQAVAGGEAFSATAVQKRIRDLVDDEPPRRPLSDDRIVAALRSAGIDIARRTVAKYRDVMGIPSSVDRRRRNGARADDRSAAVREDGRDGG